MCVCVCARACYVLLQKKTNGRLGGLRAFGDEGLARLRGLGREEGVFKGWREEGVFKGCQRLWEEF